MSRIRLEWNVESQKINKSDSEDPMAKRARRRRALRLIMLIGVVLAVLTFGVLVVRQRLLDVQGQLEQLLRETVRAEIAALRIGDINTFLAVQDNVSETWRRRQQSVFREYSDIKARHDVDLTGTILDLEIDGQRGRVVVEEIINGVRYAQVWFYRNLGDGWRHVSPDFSFWGEERRLETDAISIRYFDLDERFAQAISETVGEWLRRGCQILRCDSSPKLSIAVVKESAQTVSPAADGTATFHVLSPSSGRMSLDLPFDHNRQGLFAEALSEHLIRLATDGLQVVFPQDAVYLRRSVASYLVKEFLDADGGDSLVDSLAFLYGEEKLAELVDHLAPAASMAILQQVIGQPLEESNLDWRDFVKWRLHTEADLIESGAEGDLLNLYDTGDEEIWQAAYQRYQTGTIFRPRAVLNQAITGRRDGSAQLQVTVVKEAGEAVEEQIVLFNLVDGVWKRAN
ncbi:MAG: hypothetical protein OXG39_04030 [Chloroflexi bacterium]|nr:hypothetical protein [Chloroflexota bacterium]